MRQLVFFAVVLVVAGSYAARFADRAVETHTEPQAAVVEPAIELLEPSTSGRTLMLQSDRQGHFQVEARVEGRFVDFVVDTGASLVVLRESSAALAGIRMSPRDYTTTAVTANGRIKAAPEIASKSAGSQSTTCRPWSCPTRFCPKTCSVSHSCRGSGATNTPTAACCSNSSSLPLEIDAERFPRLFR